LSREAADPNGWEVVIPDTCAVFGAAAPRAEAEADEGIGLAPLGLTVACILAIDDAVGAYSLDEVIVLVALGREGTGGTESAVEAEDAGGAGAGRTFFRISA
jgi:hypothetical protein